MTQTNITRKQKLKREKLYRLQVLSLEEDLDPQSLRQLRRELQGRFNRNVINLSRKYIRQVLHGVNNVITPVLNRPFRYGPEVTGRVSERIGWNFLPISRNSRGWCRRGNCRRWRRQWRDIRRRFGEDGINEGLDGSPAGYREGLWCQFVTAVRAEKRRLRWRYAKSLHLAHENTEERRRKETFFCPFYCESARLLLWLLRKWDDYEKLKQI